MSDETTGFALDPAELRRAASGTARAADVAQEAGRDLVAALRDLAAALPGTRAAPAAVALAAHWEDEVGRWVAGARALEGALRATAAAAVTADAALAGRLAGSPP